MQCNVLLCYLMLCYVMLLYGMVWYGLVWYGMYVHVDIHTYIWLYLYMHRQIHNFRGVAFFKPISGCWAISELNKVAKKYLELGRR